MLKSNKLLFSAPAHVPGNPVSSGAKGRGEGSRICTKLLLSHKAAKPHSLLIATGDWLRLQKYKWLPECKWQTSKAARSMCWFYIFQRRAGIQSGRVEQGLWKSYLCPEVKAGSAVPAGSARPGLCHPQPRPSAPVFCLSLCFLIIRIHIVFSSWPARWYNPMLFHPLTQILHYSVKGKCLASFWRRLFQSPAGLRSYKKVIQTCAHFNCKWSHRKFS